MDMGAAAEDGLREGHFHVGAAPVPGPIFHKCELALTEKLGAFDIHAGRCVIRVLNVIRAGPLLGDPTRRSSLELAVLEHGEVDPAPVEVGEPYVDVLADKTSQTNFLGASVAVTVWISVRQQIVEQVSNRSATLN